MKEFTEISVIQILKDSLWLSISAENHLKIVADFKNFVILSNSAGQYLFISNECLDLLL